MSTKKQNKFMIVVYKPMVSRTVRCRTHHEMRAAIEKMPKSHVAEVWVAEPGHDVDDEAWSAGYIEPDGTRYTRDGTVSSIPTPA